MPTEERYISAAFWSAARCSKSDERKSINPDMRVRSAGSMRPESEKLEELFVECVIPGLPELTAKQLPYRNKLQVFAGSRLCGNQYVLITLLKLQCLRHVSPLGAGVKLSVVQTDEVIMTG